MSESFKELYTANHAPRGKRGSNAFSARETHGTQREAQLTCIGGVGGAGFSEIHGK